MDFGSARFSQDNEYGFQGRILPFSASSSSSSSSSSNQFKVTMLADPPIKNPIWDPSLMQYNHRRTTENTESPPQDDEGRGRGRGDYDDCRNNDNVFVEKEHMFDKVVTPSDVGKLNRLVIPKQHAEKYFPLDSTTHDKGLLLNFDDRHGKSWRFRYSYWTSSQSYVMTKGWSRFVKEKRLDAGDVVSFKRGVGEVGKDRFYIDWRRRPDMTTADPLNIFHHHNHSSIPHHFQLQQWSQPVMRPVGVGLATPLSAPRDHTLISHLHNPYRNNIITNTNGHGIVSFSGASYGYGTVVNPCHGGPVFYLRSAAPSPTPLLPMALGSGETEAEPIVIESVPVAHEKAAAKRLRLFGVNMECPIPESDEEDINVMSPHSTMVSETETENRLQFDERRPDFFDKGKSSSSMSLDFGT